MYLCVLQLNFVRFFLPLLAIGNHKKIVYLDDDIIVQGMTVSVVWFVITNKITLVAGMDGEMFGL